MGDFGSGKNAGDYNPYSGVDNSWIDQNTANLRNSMGSNVSAPYLTNYYPSGATQSLGKTYGVDKAPAPLRLNENQQKWLGIGKGNTTGQGFANNYAYMGGNVLPSKYFNMKPYSQPLI